MKKKKKSVIPRKPDGKIDWKAYDKYLVQRSMKRFGFDFVTIDNKSFMRVIVKSDGGTTGGSHVRKRIRRQKKLEGV